MILRRAEADEFVEGFGEEVVEKLEAFNVGDEADDFIVEFVNAIRKGRAAPKSGVAMGDGKADVGLLANELADFRVGEELPKLCFVVAFDDELFVEFGVADFDVLHAHPFSEVAKDAFAVDGEGEAARVEVRSPHAGVGDGGFSSGDGMGIECDGPLAVRGLGFAGFPEAVGGVAASGFSAKLLPDFCLAGAE